jgi:hypothetical protein
MCCTDLNKGNKSRKIRAIPKLPERLIGIVEGTIQSFY